MNFDNQSVVLRIFVNRLSGTIPQSFMTLTQLDVLNGNYFDCTIFTNAGLPPNDPNFRSFFCASNSLLVSLMAWTFLAITSVVILVLLNTYIKRKHVTRDRIFVAPDNLADVRSNKPFGRKSKFSLKRILNINSLFESWNRLYDADDLLDINIEEVIDESSQSVVRVARYKPATHLKSISLLVFGMTLASFRYICFLGIAISSFTLILVYAVLRIQEFQFSTHTHNYAWVISANYFYGLVPTLAIGISVILVVLCCRYILHTQFLKLLKVTTEISMAVLKGSVAQVSPDVQNDDSKKSIAVDKSFYKTASHFLKLTAIAILNFAVVGFMNGIYIFYGNGYTPRSTYLLAGIALSFFKLGSGVN